MAANYNLLALDVGERRIGLALANSGARLSQPLMTLTQSDQVFNDLQDIIAKQSISLLVVGLPRNLSGQDTAQTKYVRKFSDELKALVDIPIYYENEALSSVRAKQTLDSSKKPYPKEAIDSLAACFILDDFLVNNPKPSNVPKS
jgi:putative holliday junction resolvase